jgi:hypothetical protein
MKCEECLPRIEEYVDGELDGRMIERVRGHLSTCAGCAVEFARLEREQEIYANYRRDVEVTPAQWNIVRARIEQERDAGAQQPPTPLRGRLREAFIPKVKFRPAFVAALLLIAVGITAGVAYLNSRRPQKSVASGPSKPVDPNLPIGTAGALPPGAGKANDEIIAQDKNPEKNNSARRTQAAAQGPAVIKPAQKRAAAVANLTRPEKPAAKEQTPGEAAQFVPAVARGSLTNNMRRNAPEATGDLDFEIARHAERAGLLLRSFRNVRLPAADRALDVSYERDQSRKLLYQNIALRRDAAARGDQPATEVLNTLEPILLDIANLPNRARARDVRSIERRMEKKEIVAALQVRTLVASN